METNTLPLHMVDSLDSYLLNYGKALGRKAIHSLAPLHVPGRDPLPDFSDVLREPFPAQAHLVAASMKMFNSVGSGFVCGSMGTGKTIISMLAVHKHAQLPRKKGGQGGNYRALILCPDHLIAKWKREIEETIPDAKVTRFGPQGMAEDADPKPKRRKKGEDAPEGNSRLTLRDVVGLLGNSGGDMVEYAIDGDARKETIKDHGKRWFKPQCAEWYVLGRNQAKWLSDWTGIGETSEGQKHPVSSRVAVVDQEDVTDDKGYKVYDQRGYPVRKNVKARVHYCPKCGQVVRDKKGSPMSAKELSAGSSVAQKICQGMYLRAVASPPEKKESGIDVRPIPRGRDTSSWKPGKDVKHNGKDWIVTACEERLFNYTSRPYRWSPARIIQKKLRRFFKYLVIDEVHEQKSDESAQSMACSKLIASVDHVLALTGTIIGGYANHLYPLLMRISPKTLRDEGFEWGKDLEFSKQYGKIEKIITTKETSDSDGPSVRGNVKSMRRAKSGSRNERTMVRPGVMPTMFGRHMIGSSMFITLDQMSDDLPDLFEYVGGPLPMPTAGMTESDKDNWEKMEDGYFECAVDMEPTQAAEFRRVMASLEFANKELLRRGSMKLLGTFLWTGLDYPDRPFGWGHDPDVIKAASNEDGAVPALLGQSFLSNFAHKFEPDTKTLVLTRETNGVVETDRVELHEDCGVYSLDVTFNGRVTKSLIYDTGATYISLSAGMAAEIGLKPKKGDEDCTTRIADGSTVQSRKTTINSVKIGKLAVKDVECLVKPPCAKHTVGYWDKPKIRTIDNWVGVVTPKDCPEDVIYPKEKALIDICLKQKKDGRQTWVYVQMSGKRNVQPRLKELLEARGLRVGILRADDVEPMEREDWIAKHGREFDVMISHPQLVSTGLDLFVKRQGGHNYSTLVFYETGYNLNTMRQAARRAWRIGQPLDCRCYYLYYKETMQHKAMSLMSKKMSAAQALEGEFSEEGLAAMAGDDNLQMALAKNLSERIDEADVQRGWSKVKSGPKKPKKPTPLLDMAKDAKKSPLDDLPIELQIVAETMIEDQGKLIPEEALADFPRLAKEIAKHDHGTGADEATQEFAKHDTDNQTPEEEEEIVSIPISNKIEWDTDFDDDYVAPETTQPVALTEDILAKMFKNMMANGLKIG